MMGSEQMNIYQKALWHEYTKPEKDAYNKKYYQRNKDYWAEYYREHYKKQSAAGPQSFARKDQERNTAQKSPSKSSVVYQDSGSFTKSMEKVGERMADAAHDRKERSESRKRGMKKVLEFLGSLRIFSPAKREVDHGKSWVSNAIGEAKAYKLSEHW